MMPTTPSGTQTRAMSSPLGRVQRASTRPTGSASAAMSSRPLATPSSRFGSSASRSSRAPPMPFACAAANPRRWRRGFRRPRPHRLRRLAQRRGLGFGRGERQHSRGLACASAELGHRGGEVDAAPGGRQRLSVIGLGQHEIVAMNDHIAATVAEDGRDFTTLMPGDQPDIAARIGRKAACGLGSGAGADDHAIAPVESAVDPDDARRQEALSLAQRARGAVIDDDRAGRADRAGDPRLARGARLGAGRRTVRALPPSRVRRARRGSPARSTRPGR